MRTIAFLTFVLSAPVLGQSVVATPIGKGFETKDGGSQLAPGWGTTGWANLFMPYAQGRFQYADGELRGTPRTIKSVGYRMDYRSHTSNTALGRAWTRVELCMSELDFNKFGATFSANSVSPTRVFSAAVSWPSFTGNPTTNPAPLHPALQFPFRSPWKYSGSKGIVHDYKFSGGVLSNNGAWTGRQLNLNYYLDGAIVVTSMAGGALMYPALSACRDSAVTGTTQPAKMETQYVQYSKAYSDPLLRDKLEIPVQSFFTAPNAPVFHAVGFASIGNGIGINIGANCHNLIVDTSLPHLLFPATAGSLPNASTPRLVLRTPRTTATLAIVLWMQGAWADSKTGRFSLTTARRARNRGLGMTEVAPKKVSLTSFSLTATTGVPFEADKWTNHPLTFYTF